MSPLASTTSSPRIYCSVQPYFTARKPLALLATIPPMVHIWLLPGSGGKNRLYFASSLLRWACITPGRRITCILLASISTISSQVERSKTIPPFRATHPPVSPVPAPRGIISMSLSKANFIICWTSSVERGITTAHGLPGSNLVKNELS